MSSRNLTRPYFPNAPRDYEQSHQAEIQKAFEIFIRQLQNPGDERFTNLTLTALANNDSGLAPGDVFEQDGFLKITKANTPHPSGVFGTMALGTVTVSTP